MDSRIKDWVIEITGIDADKICKAWRWRLDGMHRIFLISKMGDMFLFGDNGSIYWLAIDGGGTLTRIANDESDFDRLLDDFKNLDNWFLPGLIKRLTESRIILKGNEVYSFKKLPVLGGEYKLENIEPLDVNIHFALTGQICEQIKDLPDGTHIKIAVGD